MNDNKLDELFIHVKNEVNERCKSVSGLKNKALKKKDFYNLIREYITDEQKDEIIKKLTPKEYYISKKLESDSDFREKVYEMSLN